jgi:hypothetical protein
MIVERSIRITAIVQDETTQCRAAIDQGVVSDYEERMAAGDVFPPIDVFGTEDECWIGDGWHRLEACKCHHVIDPEAEDFDRIPDDTTIAALLHEGGRIDAIDHALQANHYHGLRRKNADKHRAVEVAIKEFPDLSSRQIAEKCGVGHDMVLAMRPPLAENANAPATVTTKDGRQYPASRPVPPVPEPAEPEPVEPAESESDPVDAEHEPVEPDPDAPEPVASPLPKLPKVPEPAEGMSYAQSCVNFLAYIRKDDPERHQAFEWVRRWLDENE